MRHVNRCQMTSLWDLQVYSRPKSSLIVDKPRFRYGNGLKKLKVPAMVHQTWGDRGRQEPGPVRRYNYSYNLTQIPVFMLGSVHSR